MAKVKQSCEDYNMFVSYVNIRVNNLQLEVQKPVLSYIEEWFNEQQVGDMHHASMIDDEQQEEHCMHHAEHMQAVDMLTASSAAVHNHRCCVTAGRCDRNSVATTGSESWQMIVLAAASRCSIAVCLVYIWAAPGQTLHCSTTPGCCLHVEPDSAPPLH
jgi:hypothetical protein